MNICSIQNQAHQIWLQFICKSEHTHYCCCYHWHIIVVIVFSVNVVNKRTPVATGLQFISSCQRQTIIMQKHVCLLKLWFCTTTLFPGCFSISSFISRCLDELLIFIYMCLAFMKSYFAGIKSKSFSPQKSRGYNCNLLNVVAFRLMVPVYIHPESHNSSK